MSTSYESRYGWLIIALGAFTNIFAVGIPVMCMPVLFSEISKDLGLSLIQLGTIWGTGGLASMIMSPFGGLLGDRYGTKRTIMISCILFGIAGAIRALSTNFIQLALTMFVFGFIQTTVVLNIHKTCAVWFTGKKVVIANGIVCAGIALGFMLGAMISDTFMSHLLGGWKNVLFFYGIVTVVTGILWSMTKREPVHKDGDSISGSVPFKESFSKIVRIKAVWLMAIAHFCIIGSQMGLTGYLPLYLRGIGWLPANADGLLAAMNGAGMLAAIPLGIISGMIGSRKAVIIPLLLIAFISVALIPVFNGPMVWILTILFGLIRDGYFAIITTMVIETRGIGPIYGGTAIGIVFSFGNLGTFIASPAGNALGTVHPGLSFVFWAVLNGLALILFCLIKDTGKATPVIE